MSAKLQVALDFLRIEDALRVAELVKKHADFLEAGTPLIKCEGLKAVTSLKEKFPEKVIVADMKTMDTGYLEVEVAAQAGADVVGIAGAAPIETIKEAVRAKQQYEKLLMVDLIGTDPLERIQELGHLDLDIDYFEIHTAIDEQATKNPLEKLREIRALTRKNIAVAGGLNARTIPEVLTHGVNLVIVGGAITKSEDPEIAAREIKEILQKTRE